jgi:polyisoprenoid-binding protein YceI
MRFAAQWLTVVSVSLAMVQAATAADLQPVPLTGGAATISAANTKIEFIGTHTGDKPDPRHGGFRKFSGKIAVDPQAGAVKSIAVEIDTNSLFTSIPKLTDHLKTADFFEVREYPTARFESTKIAPGKDGTAQVTGKLTLHGTTKEISFPVSTQVTPKGLTLVSQFTIERSQFGMTYGAGKVDDKVTLNVVVGEPTSAK